MPNVISERLCDVAKVLQCNFTVKNQPVDYEKVFSELGLLPGIMRRADQLCSFCLGYGLGVTFDDSQGAMLGVTVKFDDATPTSLRLLCATDVLIEIIQQAPSREVTPLDDLMYD
jgi:intracellular multiplication protein IcmS